MRELAILVFTPRVKERRRRHEGKDSSVSLTPKLDGYLLNQLRVLITYDYKFNRTSFVITASSREHITVRNISFCHTGTLRVTVPPCGLDLSYTPPRL